MSSSILAGLLACILGPTAPVHAAGAAHEPGGSTTIAAPCEPATGWSASARASRALPLVVASDLDTARRDAGWTDAFTFAATDDPRVLRVEYGGLAVDGASARIAFDRHGRVRGAAIAPRELRASVVGEFELDECAVREALAARFSGETARPEPRVGAFEVGPDLELGEARRVWRATDAGLVPSFVIELSRGARSQVELVVDARDAAVLDERELVRSGGGSYPWYGETVEFPTGKARANVFVDADDALAGRITQRKLHGWSLGVPDPVGLSRGYLVGARVDVYDAWGEWAIHWLGHFDYAPDFFPQFFDQANAYWHVDGIHRHLRKALGRELVTDYALPVIVNVPDSVPGGYYSPAALPDGHVSGYVVLNDLEAFLGPGADSARDATLVAHEYVHAWLARDGRSFDGAAGDPTRAIEEALADFFATAKHGGHVVGGLFEPWGVPGWPRDLDDGQHLLETLLEAQALGGGALDEHRASEVLGAFFVDVRRERGTKRTERWLDRAIELMPHSFAELGVAQNASADPVGAASIGFASVALSLLATADSHADAAAVIGSATGRGIFGASASAYDAVVHLEALPKRAITLPSGFAHGDEVHVYSFRAAPGRELTITVQASAGSDVRPDFELVGPHAELAPKKFTSGGLRVVQSGLVLEGDVDTTYELRVRSTSGASGRYRARIDG
ncbi:MAG: hypothetical protein L6Q99_20060 [Planctomycetes bacterium]|nr:hypothetical protein [Planctomycetota bacterium]